MSQITRNSVGLASCLLSLLRYMFLLLLFILICHHLHSCTLVTLKWNTCVRKALWQVLSLILPACLGRSMLTALTALLGSTLLAAIQMSQAIPSLEAPGRWVLFHPCSLSFLSLHLNICSNNLSFNNLAYCSGAWEACLACRQPQARVDWVLSAAIWGRGWWGGGGGWWWWC